MLVLVQFDVLAKPVHELGHRWRPALLLGIPDERPAADGLHAVEQCDEAEELLESVDVDLTAQAVREQLSSLRCFALFLSYQFQGFPNIFKYRFPVRIAEGRL